MASQVKIKVVSIDGGTPSDEPGATVCMVKRHEVGGMEWPYKNLTATHKHDKEGYYIASDASKEPSEGEWLLVVSKAGRSPVVQRLRIAKDKDAFKVSPGWNAREGAVSQTAATVSIMPYDRKKLAEDARFTLILIMLYPRKEIVMVASHDHLGGTRYIEFAKGRMSKLYRLKKLDAGSIVTIFGANEKKRFTMVKSASPDHKSWVTVEEAEHNAVSITSLYSHLDSRGKEAAGTVIEAGVFGHSYYIGPIIWNTYDRSSSLTERDPADLDGRAKDWTKNGPTMAKYPKLRDAFHKDGCFRVWGCNHMPNVISEAANVNRHLGSGGSRDAPFLMRLNSYEAVESGTVEHVKRNIAQYAVSNLIWFSAEFGDARGVVSYAGLAAQFLGIPCFWSPPGAGSLYRGTGDGMEGYVSKEGESKPVYDFFRREYGDSFSIDDNNYMDYQKFLSVKLPDPGWSTQRWFRYTFRSVKLTILRLPSGMEVFRREGTFEAPVAMAHEGVQGHLYAALKSRPEKIEARMSKKVIFVRRADDEDCGVLVLSDGRSLLMRRRGRNGAWELNPDAVEVWKMKLATVSGWRWEEEPGSTRGSVRNSELEKVTPAFYW